MIFMQSGLESKARRGKKTHKKNRDQRPEREDALSFLSGGKEEAREWGIR